MNKRIRTLCLVFALLIGILGFSLTVYADEGDFNDGTGNGGGSASSTPVIEPTTPQEPATSAPVYDPTSAPTQSGGTNTGDYSDNTQNGYDDGYDDGYDNNQNSGYVDSYTNDDGYYYYDEEEMINNIDDTAGNVSDYTDLYDASDMNEADLKESEWSNISLDTSKENKNVADFSAIKNNNDASDNGEWIVYTGIVLIALSLLGILYFIVATATYKRKLKALQARDMRQRRRERDKPLNDYGDMLDEFQSSYTPRPQRKRYASSNELSYSERKRRKADTAEINIPKKYQARH